MDGRQVYAVYERFIIEDEASLYKMNIGSCVGTVYKEALKKYCDGDIFLTYDKDDDNFAVERKSGLWECGNVNLNGVMKEKMNDHEHVHWENFVEGVGTNTPRKTKMTLILKTTP